MHYTEQTQFKQLTNLEKGHVKKNIKYLLQQHYWFRLWIRFKYDPDYHGPDRASGGLHFYGNEHKCTYNQCVSGKVKEIVLDRWKGYNDLIQLIEKGEFKGKYITAKIYGYDPQTGAYDILHRVYLRGKLQKKEVNDPVLDTKDEFLTLHFTIQDNRVIIQDPPSADKPETEVK